MRGHTYSMTEMPADTPAVYKDTVNIHVDVHIEEAAPATFTIILISSQLVLIIGPGS